MQVSTTKIPRAVSTYVPNIKTSATKTIKFKNNNLSLIFLPAPKKD